MWYKITTDHENEKNRPYRYFTAGHKSQLEFELQLVNEYYSYEEDYLGANVEQIDKPPKEWIEQQISFAYQGLKEYQKQIDFYTKLLDDELTPNGKEITEALTEFYNNLKG